jgi:acyl transferase domain-containing protein
VLFPASAFVAIALAAARDFFGDQPQTVSELVFHRALPLVPEAARLLQTVVQPPTAGVASFQILSRRLGSDDDTWVPHCSGSLERTLDGARADEASFELGEIQERCREEISSDRLYVELWERRLEYGPLFQGIHRVWRRDGEALADVRLPAGLRADAPSLDVHPALLDACFQALAAALPAAAREAGGTFLPQALARFRIREPIPARVWSHATVRISESGAIDADVRLLTDEGTVAAETLGLRLQRVGGSEREIPIAECLYEVAWRVAPRAASRSGETGSWLVFADAGGIAEDLARRLETRGQMCFLAFRGSTFERIEMLRFQVDPTSPDDLARLLDAVAQDASTPVRHVLHLFGLDASDEKPSIDQLSRELDVGCGGLLRVVQALARSREGRPRLVLVTSGAQQVEPGDGTDGTLGQACLWGLARTIALEHPGLRCQRIDLPRGDRAGCTVDLLAELDC